MKLYSNRSYLSDSNSHVTLLNPFWGNSAGNNELIDQGRRFDRYAQIGESLFEMVPLAEAEAAVLPADWEPNTPVTTQLEQFASDIESAGVPLIVFFWEDSFEPIPLDNSVVFRTSFHRSTRRPFEYAVPVWSEDLVQEYTGGTVQIRQKSDVPTIGFCGFADPLTPTLNDRALHILRYSKAILQGKFGRRAAGWAGRRLRTRALKTLLSSPVVNTNFVVRSRFFAGAISPDGTLDAARFRQVRQEFVQNMLDTDYTLCIRGAGNFSIRLYETLCCGRTPVFVDTDSPLPYDFAVNWRDYVVWVDSTDIDRIGEIVAEFHANLSLEEFENRQRAARQFWEDWLSPHGFFTNFHLHFAADE